MLPLPTEATIEEKMNTCKNQHHPLYHWRTQIIQANCIHASRHSQHRWQREGQENLEWERVIGLLTPATKLTIALWNGHGCCHTVSSQFFYVKSRMGKGHWVTDICYRVDYCSLNLPWLLSFCVQSSFWCYLHCLVHKTRDFPDLKSKCKQIAIFEPIDYSYMWKESQI